MKSAISRFLVTTAEEASWPSKGASILFLGEWCRLYERKEVWEGLDAELMPYHWDDRQKLDTDFHYLIKLHETLLSELAQKLNEIHAVNYSLRYWRVLVGPWLGYFTQILFDRWSSIKQAESEYDLSGTIILQGNEEELVPNDMSSFIAMFLEDTWNHHIYSLIIKKFTHLRFETRRSKKYDSELISDSSFLSGIKQNVRKILYSVFRSLFQRRTDFFFTSTYLSFFDELKLSLRLRQSPQLREIVKPVEAITDFNLRNWILPGKSNLEFEHCIRELIPQQIPRIYLEGYQELNKQTQSLNWPDKPKGILTANGLHSDDVFKAWTALQVEKGTPLLTGQHGGHYGIGKWSFVEQHELAISDAFLSWGWEEKNNQKVRPVGMLKRKLPMNIEHAVQPNILLVNNINPRQSYYLFNSTISRQWLDYLEEQFNFVDSLPQTLRNSLIVRLHPLDWGWAPLQRWKDRFPALRIDQNNSDIKASIRDCRIYVATYNATTFLESLVMDVPTVIFWNRKQWELRASAIPYFEELKRVGVFHDTPESAAIHVSKVWNDVNAWWKSAEVKSVICSFKESYCDVSPHLIKNLEKTLEVFYNNEMNG